MEWLRNSWKNKWVKRSRLVLFWLLGLLILLEVSYRYQWVDYYATEWKALNHFKPDEHKKNLLVFGDSFSAQRINYTQILRDSLTEFNHYNAAIPGTCARHASYICSRRIETTKPEVVIYQMYLGNDLTDESYPTNWSEVSTTRNLYWTVCSWFRIVAYFNYRFGQMGANLNTDFDRNYVPDRTIQFDPEKYSPRTKMLIRATPKGLGEIYQMRPSVQRTFQRNLNNIKHIQNQLPEGTEFYVLVLPSPSFVNTHYHQHYQRMGMTPFSLQKKIPCVVAVQQFFSPKIVLDPVPMFQRQEEKGNAMFYTNDDHLSPGGQKALGNWMVQQLKERMSITR